METKINQTISTAHIPVMLDEVIDALNIKKGWYLDCTFGGGGYTKAILNKNNDAHVIAIDRDKMAIENGQNLVQNTYKHRLFLEHAKFSNIQTVAAKFKEKMNNSKFAGIVMDLGVSSTQIDNSGRGFSFKKDGPLSMTMGLNNFSAFDIVNKMEEESLADLIFIYGDEPKSRAIAKAIVNARKNSEIQTTGELAKIIHKTIGTKKSRTIDNATKTFQAIRIAVNDELNELESCLKHAISLLAENGVLVTVTFHSGEDRIVKNFFKQQKLNKVFIKTALTKVNLQEIKKNVRARSAKMRTAIFSNHSKKR